MFIAQPSDQQPCIWGDVQVDEGGELVRGV